MRIKCDSCVIAVIVVMLCSGLKAQNSQWVFNVYTDECAIEGQESDIIIEVPEELYQSNFTLKIQDINSSSSFEAEPLNLGTSIQNLYFFSHRLEKNNSFKIHYLDQQNTLITAYNFNLNTLMPVEKSITHNNCHGGEDGSVILSGDSEFEVLWADGSTDKERTNLKAGKYDLKLYHSSGCVQTKYINIREPQPIDISFSALETHCGLNAERSVSVDITGGNPPYRVDWLYDGENDGDDELIIEDMPEDTYYLRISDSNACEQTFVLNVNYVKTYIVQGNEASVFSHSKSDGVYEFNLMDATNLENGDLDNNGMNGSNLDVSFYLNENEALAGQNSVDYSFFSDKETLVIAKIETEHGCFDMVPVILKPAAEFNMILTVGESCDDGDPEILDGTFQIFDGMNFINTPIPPGGTWEIYEEDEMGNLTLITDMITCDMGVCTVDPKENEGNYKVYYYVAGDTYIGDYEVQALNPSVNIVPLRVCGNIDNFLITANPKGGIMVGQGIINQEDIDLSTVYAVDVSQLNVFEKYYYAYTYDFMLGSGMMCPQTSNDSIVIDPFPSVNILTSPSESCAGSSITMTGTGQLAGFSVSYSWYDPSDNVIGNSPLLTLDNVTETGYYKLEISAGNGCSNSDQAMIQINELPDVDCMVTASVSCAGGSDATAFIDVLNATDLSSFSFEWPDGLDSQGRDDLQKGIYEVTITNGSGCIATCEVTVGEPPTIVLNCTDQIIPIACNGDPSGVFTVDADGGTPPYVYSIDKLSFQPENMFTGVPGGTIKVYVMDENLCIDSCSFTMPEPPVLTCGSRQEASVSCYDGIDGRASVTPIGGTLPYRFRWEGGQTTASVDDLGAGTFFVTVLDGNDCECVNTVTINEPEELRLTCSITDEISCNNQSDGALIANVIGGTSPFTILWNTDDTEFAINLLPATTYSAIITDFNGCQANCSIMLDEPMLLEANAIGSAIDCFNHSDGTASTNAMGGTPPYSYLWTDGETSPNLTNKTAGTYTVTLTDRYLCSVEETIEITAPPAIEVDLLDANVCLDFSVAIPYRISGGDGPYRYNWTINNAGTTEATDANIEGISENSISFNSFCLKPGTVELNLEVIDASNCIYNQKTNVNLDMCFDLALMKIFKDPQEAYIPGDTVGFILEIFNQGSIDAFNVEVTDFLEPPLLFDPTINTNSYTGNEQDWIIDGENVVTNVNFLAKQSSKKIEINLVIDPDFLGKEFINFAEITFYSNELKDLPYDEDDLPPGVMGTEKNDDVEDDSNGSSDNPNDNDRRDFESGRLCGDNEFACNKFVNISVDTQCEVFVTADMFVTGIFQASLVNVSLEDLEGNPISNPIDVRAMINDTIVGIASDRCDDYKCWSFLILEDKRDPILICRDTFFINCIADTVKLEEILIGDSDNCYDTEIIVYSDTYIDCPIDGYSKFRKILYYAEDEVGMTSDTCEQVICYREIDIYQVDLPKDTTYACIDGSLEWDLDGNVYPDLEESGVPSYMGYDLINPDISTTNDCLININYEDTRLEDCGMGFTIIRNWILIDWCNSILVQEEQIIKLRDNNIPKAVCPPQMDFPSNKDNCLAEFILDPYGDGLGQLTSYDDCSNLEDSHIEVHYLLNSELNTDNWIEAEFTNDRTFIVSNLEIGINWVRYTIADECGNQVDCTWEINITDTTPPNPVCDEFTKVSLDKSGWATMDAISIDDLSHDDCSDVRFGIRRLEYNCEVIEGFADTVLKVDDLVYFNRLAFCCEDLEEEFQEVELIIIDEAGNYATCIAKVVVEDKNPVYLVCDYLEDKILTCGVSYEKSFDIVNEYEAACPNYTIQSSDHELELECGEKNITRTWTLLNQEGAGIDVCSQTLRIRIFEEDISETLMFPGSRTISCSLNGYDPEDNPEVGYLVLPDVPCSNLEGTYSDLIFRDFDNLCLKIIRTWYVYNWCIFDANDPNTTGFYTAEQVIKVENTEAPELTCEDQYFEIRDNDCTLRLDLEVDAEDDCTTEDYLTFHYLLDIDNDDTIDDVGNSNAASFILKAGTHKISWSAFDACGNMSHCDQIITIEDKKAPTPYCNTGFSASITAPDNNLEIWAADFDLGSVDNCSDELFITFNKVPPLYPDEVHYFKKNPHGTAPELATEQEYLDGNAELWDPAINSSSKVFNCHNEGLRILKVWYFDEAGNSDYCETSLNIEIAPGACNSNSSKFDLYGTVSSVRNDLIVGAEIKLAGEEEALIAEDVTDIFGFYAFLDLERSEAYQLEAAYKDDYLNGVSTLDLAIIQNHILGRNNLSSVYDLIAADVNSSENINTIDLLELRKLILGIYDELPSSPSWQLIPAHTAFADPHDPWPLETNISIEPNADIGPSRDFVAIKVGDVNQSFNMLRNSTHVDGRNTASKVLWLNDKEFQAGEKVHCRLEIEDISSVSGFQLTIEFDQEILNFMDLVSVKEVLGPSNIGLGSLEQGEIVMSWTNADYSMAEDLLTIELEFISKRISRLSEAIQVSDKLLSSEAYNQEFQVSEFELITRVNNDLKSSFVLHQNRPNPLRSESIIPYEVNRMGTVGFEIFDSMGQRVFENSEEVKAGNHELIIDNNLIKLNPGVYYYQMKFGNEKQSKRMIIIQ